MTDFAWSDASVARLEDHWREGCSAAICAGKLGEEFGQACGYLSRSAVIGKVHRLKLNIRYPRERPTQSVRVRAARRARLSRAIPALALPRSPARAMKPVRRAVVALPPPIPEPVSLRVALLDLEPRHCRWPLGDPLTPGFAFCGCDRPKVTILDKPEFDPTTRYCEFHEDRARR